MTERSWLWDGTATGDASLAPYARNAFNRWFIAGRYNDLATQAYVLPGYHDDLLILASEDQTVSTLTVKAGAAVIDDFVYVSDTDQYFPVAQLALSSYRYDSLILRVTRDETPEVRMVLVQGNESSTYPPPPYTLEQDANGTWEVEIARVLVDASVYTLDGSKLEVFTRYMPIAPHYDPDTLSMQYNTELLAVSETGLVAGVIEGTWAQFSAGGGLPTPTITTAIGPQSRGNAVRLAQGGYTWYVPFDGTLHDRITVEGTIEHLNSTTRTVVTLEYLKNYLTYSAIKQSDTIGLNTEDIHHFLRTFEVPSDTQIVLMKVYPTAASGNSFDIGQIIISPGYFTGSRRPFHEVIHLENPIEDTSWDGDAKSSGTTTINLAADFGGIVPQHVKAVLLEVRCRDSGSAGGAGVGIDILSYTSAWTYGSVLLDGVTNNYWRTGQIIAYINEPFQQSLSTNRGFRITVNATGAGTLDAYVEIVGFIV